MFAFMFPVQARQLSDQARQLSEQAKQLSQQTTQLGQQAALISRLYAANAYLRAQNDTLQSTGDFAEKNVQRFKKSVAAMLLKSDNILTINPTLRSVLPVGVDVLTMGHEKLSLTLCSFAPPPRRENLEALRAASCTINIDNFASVLGKDDVQEAISRLEMWASDPVISAVLGAAYRLM